MLEHFTHAKMACAALGLGLGLASLAAAEPLSHRSATLQCAERRIAVDADCFRFAAGTLLCARQSIRFFGRGGKALGARSFPSTPMKNADHPVVEARFGELQCVETADKRTFVVTLMDNGGNCEQCEWHDVYSIDGVLLGSTRERRQRNDAVDGAVAAVYDKKSGRVLNRQALSQFYREDSPAFACPSQVAAAHDVSYDTMIGVHKELVKRFDAALGAAAKNPGDPKVAATRVDDARMAALADVSGCAALIDVRGACAQFFDPELGDPLSVFMDMKTTAPLRRQFEEAIAQLARPDYRRAAQACIRRVGRK